MCIATQRRAVLPFRPMNGIKLIEDGKLSGVRITDAGFLVANVNCARTGIQEYRGSEIGLDTHQIFRVWRPEEEVFSEDSMASYAGKPATDDHPSELVDKSNWKKLAVGNIGSKVLRSGEFVNVPLILMDGGAIDKAQAGKVELSMGYTADWDMTAGINPEGEPYDAIQRNLKMNHIALVDKGRAGAAVRIGDSWLPDAKTIIDKPTEKPTMTTKKITVDGLEVETTDAAEKAIIKLQGQVTDATSALESANAVHATAMTTATAAHDTALAAKDTELATKDSKIAELEKSALTDVQLDAKVAERAEFMAKVTPFTGDADLTGKSTHEMMLMAVDAVRGAEFTKDKSETYIAAAFDMLEAPEQEDAFRATVKSQKPPTNDKASNDNGHSKYVANISDAWKGNAGAKA